MNSKEFVSPLLVVLVLQLAVAGALWRRLRAATDGRARRLTAAVIGLAVALVIAAMPLTADLAEASLELGAGAPRAGTPAAVVVLGGGYEAGATPALDVLGVESGRRVLAGVACWRRTPWAVLVLAGAADVPGRSGGRLAELMAEAASAAGVPATSQVRDTLSRNTREHPLALSRLGVVPPMGSVAIATSSWHLRRALREFRRTFPAAEACAESLLPGGRSSQWYLVLPSADALDRTTTMLREWVGILWYRLVTPTRRA